MYVHPATLEQRIDLRPATAVHAIEPGSRQVVLESEERIAFDRLLIATGARPRTLSVPGANLPGVLTLRTLADADAIHAAAIDAERIVVIGAGWIGSEVAASLRMLGRTVVLMAPEAVPLERVLGPEIGGVYRDLHLSTASTGGPARLGRILGTARSRQSRPRQGSGSRQTSSS